MNSVIRNRLNVRDARFWLGVLIVVVLAVAIKMVYVRTAESLYSAEELPLAAISVAGGDGRITDIAVTRLYGTSNLTTAASLKVLGFDAMALKAPNMLFGLLTIVLIYLSVANLIKEEKSLYALWVATAFALGPPIIQIWSLKNRGGFIENIFGFALCIWICSRAQRTERRLAPIEILIVGLVIGVCIWSQPIGIVWGSVMMAFVALTFLGKDLKGFLLAVLLLLFGLSLGLMPLLQLNLLFDFRTLKTIEGGELVNGADLGMANRALALIKGGVPRVLGLKEQWSDGWVVGTTTGWLLYISFMLAVIAGGMQAMAACFRKRAVTVEIALLTSAALVLVANVVSSWGNFQLEPRRLLLLYVPFFILAGRFLYGRGAIGPFLLALWLMFSCYANISYISKHKHGYSNSMFIKLNGVAEFLKSQNVVGVYANVWTGSRVTFESKGAIVWFRSDYTPSSYGYLGDTVLLKDEAMLFNNNMPAEVGLRDKFLADLKKQGDVCMTREIQDVSIVYGCNREIELRSLSYLFSNSQPVGTEIYIGSDDQRIKTQQGEKKDSGLVSNGKSGYLAYGPYISLGPGKYEITLYGTSTTPATLDVCHAHGRKILASKDVQESVDLGGKSILGRLDIDIAIPVSNLEVRVRVGEGSDTAVEGIAFKRVD
ncbi:hypothetical protein [Pseudoxanthomonas dokdonensis]|nr:hypothetical protein [Pseudoxanthomonas dokdonensis]